jgi:hypothetical protein
MANAKGQEIEAVDYNVIRNKINLVMGPGIGQLGYGQTVYSADVAESQQITAQQWNLLRYDLFNARVHQDGTSPTIVQATPGSVITFSSANPNNQYNSQADTANVNKFNIGSGQFSIDAGASTSRTTSWTSAVSCTCTVTFGSADQARWFFNSGGKIRFTSSRAGGTSSAQNTAWSSLLAGAGTFEFGAVTPSGVNFYSLNNLVQTFYSATSTGAYSGNLYTLSAQSNVANNINGGASVIQFTAVWQDTYVYTGSGSSSFPDLVDGTLTLTVDELRASGVLQNGTGTPGVFSITSPSYSITSITGS